MHGPSRQISVSFDAAIGGWYDPSITATPSGPIDTLLEGSSVRLTVRVGSLSEPESFIANHHKSVIVYWQARNKLIEALDVYELRKLVRVESHREIPPPDRFGAQGGWRGPQPRHYVVTLACGHDKEVVGSLPATARCDYCKRF